MGCTSQAQWLHCYSCSRCRVIRGHKKPQPAPLVTNCQLLLPFRRRREGGRGGRGGGGNVNSRMIQTPVGPKQQRQMQRHNINCLSKTFGGLPALCWPMVAPHPWNMRLPGRVEPATILVRDFTQVRANRALEGAIQNCAGTRL